jgi:aspartokinase
MAFVRPSVPEAVKTIILSNPHLYECMKMKVLNYNAVASLIKPAVEQIVGKEVNHNTVVAALVRFASTLERTISESPIEALKDARISLTTGVSDIVIRFPEERHKEFMRRISEILQEVEADFANIHQFPSFAKLILSSDVIEKIREELRELDASFGEGYARITIRLPSEIQDKGSVMDYVVETLSREGIEQIDGFFGGKDIVLLVRETDASRAFEVLRRSLQGTSFVES